MKIVAYDNFGMSGEQCGRDEFFLEDGRSMSKEAAEKLCKILIADMNDYSTWMYRVVEDDYKLSKFEP